MNVEYLPFENINAFKNKKIFIEYINRININSYNHGFSVHEIAKIKNEKEISNALAQKLKKYNNNLLPDKSVDENIEKLTENGTHVVITGQQPHIYAGPLYTLYKIITAIKLSKTLTLKTGQNYIPVFWNGSDDHDIDEINKLEFPDKQYGLNTFRFDINHTGEPIYNFKTSKEFEKTNIEIFYKLRETDFTAQVKELFTNHTKNIAENVSYVYKKLFHGQGLVVLEPKILREFSKHIYKKIILNDIEINNTINETGKSGIGLIQKDNISNLFAHINGKREKIMINNKGFRCGDKTFLKNDFADYVYENAVEFSPGVGVRPVVQDYLFPTCAYVAGPGEVSYFSQLKNVYSMLETNMPAIFPRVSATVITGREKRVIDKYGFAAHDIINGNIEISDDSRTEQEKIKINEFTKQIWKQVDNLTEYVKDKGNEPLQSINSSLRKIEYELNKVEEKYIKAYERLQGVERGQIEKLKSSLTPNNALQERIFSPLYYINLFGQNFINNLIKSFNIDEFKHHVITLD